MKKRLVKKLAKQAVEVYKQSDDGQIYPVRLRRALSSYLLKRVNHREKTTITREFWREFDKRFYPSITADENK